MGREGRSATLHGASTGLGSILVQVRVEDEICMDPVWWVSLVLGGEVCNSAWCLYRGGVHLGANMQGVGDLHGASMVG